MNLDLEPTDLWDELLRAGEVPAPTDVVLESARVAVRRQTGNELRLARRRKSRRRLRYAVVAAAVVGLLTAGVVSLGGHRVAIDSAAAATLRKAATATLAEHDLTVGPGQYLKVTLVQRSWSAAYGDIDGKSRLLLGRDGKPLVTEGLWTRTLWIPHDTRARWFVREHDHQLTSVSSDPEFHRPKDEPTRTWSTRSWGIPGNRNYVKTYDPRWYATLSRDPQTLIRQLDHGFTGEGHGLAYRFSENYSEILRSGLAPASVRAALFRGLAETPGMEVLGDVTTLNGRHGIAIGAEGAHFAMVFDKTTGLYIGDRATDPTFPDVPGLDAAKTTFLSSVTTTVVDHAP